VRASAVHHPLCYSRRVSHAVLRYSRCFLISFPLLVFSADALCARHVIVPPRPRSFSALVCPQNPYGAFFYMAFPLGPFPLFLRCMCGYHCTLFRRLPRFSPTDRDHFSFFFPLLDFSSSDFFFFFFFFPPSILCALQSLPGRCFLFFRFNPQCSPSPPLDKPPLFFRSFFLYGAFLLPVLASSVHSFFRFPLHPGTPFLFFDLFLLSRLRVCVAAQTPALLF